jgi:hypothetical protein
MVDDPAAGRPARLGDIVGLGRLFLAGLAFWSAMACVFAGQIVLLQLGSPDPAPFHRVLINELASWLPCALLTPALVAGALRVRGAGLSLSRVLLLHAIGALLFLVVGGGLMGVLESLVP